MPRQLGREGPSSWRGCLHMGLGTAHEVKHHWGFGCPVYGAAVLFESLILNA